MKICLFSISPKCGGGVVTKTILLIKYLKSQGCSVDWYYPRHKGESPSYVHTFINENNIKPKEINSIPYFRALDAFDPLHQIPKTYDIYQVVSGFCLDGMVFRQLKNEYFIWSASTFRSEKYNSQALKFYRPKELISKINIVLGKHFEKKYSQFAYKIFSNSLFTKNEISSALEIPPEKIRVVYPIIDLDKYSYLPLKKRSPKEKYILFVGIFSKRKNIDLLLRSFRELYQCDKELRLKLVGNNNGYFAFYRGLCKNLGINDSVDFIGEKKDITPFYKNALVTVLPSKREGFGMVLAESLACGTPVVATRCGGTKEIIDDGVNGFLVDDNEIEMADAISRIIYDINVRDKMSLTGRKKIENQFSMEKIGKIFMNEYKSYIKRKALAR